MALPSAFCRNNTTPVATLLACPRPGIQATDKAVRDLAKEWADGNNHPWDQAVAFWHWVRGNIRPLIGEYTILRAVQGETFACSGQAQARKPTLWRAWLRLISGRAEYSVTAALKNRRGDCEEMAAVFVALCRACDIPARLVWVPNHNWAEFFLLDGAGQGHWIPVHTASYFWFGWTGVHELVLQKGDRIKVPERTGKEWLLEDWIR